MRRSIAATSSVAVLILFAGVLSADEAEDQAIEALQAAGGSVRVIAADTEEKEAAFHLSGKDIDDNGLAPLGKVTQLVWLNLRGTKITDAGLPHVGACKSLTRLHLEKTGITDAGLVHLKDLAALEYLNLYGTQISDAGLEHLTGLTSLKKLYVWETKVTDEGAKKLELKASKREPYANVIRLILHLSPHFAPSNQ